jgi:hypothetical protein
VAGFCCGAKEECVGGACVEKCPKNKPRCGDGCCPIDRACCDGVCCPTRQTCVAGACCPAGQACIDGRCQCFSREHRIYVPACGDVCCSTSDFCGSAACPGLEGCIGSYGPQACVDGQCQLCPEGLVWCGGSCCKICCNYVCCEEGECCAGGVCTAYDDNDCGGVALPPGAVCCPFSDHPGSCDEGFHCLNPGADQPSCCWDSGFFFWP